MTRTTLIIGCILVVVAGGAFLLFRHNGTDARPATSIRFVSLAWQEQALAANRAIVAEWNVLHPDMPVEYVQGTWNSVYDYLITSFETGDVPDVFHFESSVIVDFARRGYLQDLGPMIDAEMKEDILDVAWASVTRPGGEVTGVPFLMESLIGLYNVEMLREAGIEPPTMEKPWSWSDLRDAARKLTVDSTHDGVPDRWGVAIGLRSSGNIIMNLSVGFGGSFYRKEGGRYVVRVGQEERNLLETLHGMMYDDHTMAPSSAGQSGAGMIPGFFAGRYAMLIGIGAWGRQQLVENAPAGFHWGVMPPLKAVTQRTGMSTQTLSIPRASRNTAGAMAFIKFMLRRDNMARLALSDWMLPARRSCLTLPAFVDAPSGWSVTTASARFLSTGSWLGAPGYVEWKNRVANPVLQEYFAGRLSIEEVAQRIEVESNVVLSRYQEGQQ